MQNILDVFHFSNETLNQDTTKEKWGRYPMFSLLSLLMCNILRNKKVSEKEKGECAQRLSL